MDSNRSRLWKRIGEVELCEFDRLLLARAVDVHAGSLDGLEGDLRGARLEPSGECHRDADLLLSQLADLRERLGVLRASPADLVGSRPVGAHVAEAPLYDFIRAGEETSAMQNRNAYLRLARRAIRAPWRHSRFRRHHWRRRGPSSS